MQSYYFYRNPGETDVHSGSAPCALQGLHEGGFVIAPFIPDLSKAVTIPFATSVTAFPPGNLPDRAHFPFPESSTSQSEHRRAVEEIVAGIKHGDSRLSKVVLSRVILADASFTPIQKFEALCQAYPNAFVFCFTTPQTGTWIGASPELLLKSDGNCISTMALAGTRPAGSDIPWDDKNREEQAIVRRYIANVLSTHGLTPEISDTYTRLAGPVEHLCNDISAHLPSSFRFNDMRSLLHDLSPTPALGGFPKQKAIEVINELERHSRGYYGGFIGPIESTANFGLYVNLRSMQLQGSTAAVYVGGGITADSCPDDEWTETTRKSATLLAIDR